jgi:hypothetical protein
MSDKEYVCLNCGMSFELDDSYHGSCTRCSSLDISEIPEAIATMQGTDRRAPRESPETEELWDATDKVKHYQVTEDLEAKDIIRIVVELSGLTGYRAYCLGNILKYALRYGRKDIEQLEAGKIRNYATYLEETYEDDSLQ